MAGLLSLSIRYVHLLGMVVLVGGAANLWWTLRTDRYQVSQTNEYEWVFWGGLGLILVTGIGNIGSIEAVAPTTFWGRTLTIKLVVVIVFVIGSFLRTMLVIQGPTDEPPSAELRATLQLSYGLTAVYLLFIVALAEVLAHG